jgi:heterodisulfide reductase subunit C
LKVVFAEDAEHVCGKCLACAEACRLGLNPIMKPPSPFVPLPQGERGRGEGHYNGIYPQCHNCGACIAACDGIHPEKRPLIFKF